MNISCCITLHWPIWQPPVQVYNKLDFYVFKKVNWAKGHANFLQFVPTDQEDRATLCCLLAESLQPRLRIACRHSNQPTLKVSQELIDQFENESRPPVSRSSVPMIFWPGLVSVVGLFSWEVFLAGDALLPSLCVCNKFLSLCWLINEGRGYVDKWTGASEGEFDLTWVLMRLAKSLNNHFLINSTFRIKLMHVLVGGHQFRIRSHFRDCAIFKYNDLINVRKEL